MQHIYHRFTIDNDPALTFTPVRMVEIELSKPLSGLSVLNDWQGQPYRKARCLVRLHSQPLGIVELALENGSLSAELIAENIWRDLGEQVNTHLIRDGLPPVSGLGELRLSDFAKPACLEERERFFAKAPFASVIVPTRNRIALLRRCLTSLLALRYPHYEIIVVDNVPTSSSVAEFIEQLCQDEPKVRYVREDRPGLSFARNRGIQEANGNILAITDDDVVVDANWLLELARGFQASENVVCVSGLVLSMELETQAQSWFEQFGGYDKGFTGRLFDLSENHPGTPLFPYTAGLLGTGANIAFEAAYLRQIGGFDPTLGAGTPTKGGEELAVFFQLIMGGYTMAYQPAALLYHPPHRNYADLRQQIYGYGVGITAYITKCMVDQPTLFLDLVKKIPKGLDYTLSARSPKNSRKSAGYPKELTRLELRGLFYGPLAYLRSRRLLRRSRRARDA
jgi:glycosyltransferase involved in cell wall biosynthesis